MAMSLVQLQMLAQERLPSRHHQLLREIADRLCDAGPAAEERAQLAQLLDDALDEAEEVARQEFAERIARHADAPRSIVVRLAGDLIAVAAPVLINSLVLDDDDLADIARERSANHQLAIAKRTQLSARVTDVLITTGDALVLDCVAQNLGARFSADGAAELVDKAQSRPPLWRRLLARPDLAITSLMTGTGRLGTSRARPREVREGAQVAVSAELRDLIAMRLRATAAPGRTLDELADLITSGRLQLCDAVTEIADADRVADLGVMISGRRDVASHDFVRELFAPDVVALMRRCCAAGLGLEGFSAVLRLRRRRLLFAVDEVGPLLRRYRALTSEAGTVTTKP